MQTDLLGDAVTETRAIVHPPALPRAYTRWRVATWYAPWNNWKLHPDEWADSDKAAAWAQRFLSETRGHTHYCIFRLEYPGMNGQ